jgi:ABC-type oligopeptide transport system substrate-binding subunit
LKHLQRRGTWLALLLVFALLIAACGDDDVTTTAAPAATTTTVAATTLEPTTLEPGEVTTLSGLRVIDNLTFEIELITADPEFPLRLAYAAYFPLPQAFFDDPDAFEEAPVGNGPFMMDGVWNHDQNILLSRWEDYPGSNAAQVDELEFVIFADMATAYNEALAGNLDVVDTVLPDFLDVYQADFPDRNAEALTTGIGYLGFPTYVDAYTKEVRQALNMAVDIDLVVETVFQGARDPAHSVIPPNLAGAREFVCDSWSFDPDTAMDLWEAAAFDGDLILWYNEGSGHELWVEAIVNQWGQNLGIDTSAVQFEPTEWSEYLPTLDDQGATGPFRLGWGMDYPSPYNFLDPLFGSEMVPPVGSNNVFYNNPDFDQALADGVAAFAASGDLADAIPFYQQAEDMLCDDAQIIPVYFSKSQYVWNEGVDNIVVDAFGDLGYTAATADDGSVSTAIVEPEHLQPTNSNESEGIAVLRALFAPLIQYDPNTMEQFMLVADSVTSDDGGLTWTVVLNDGWTFHNGEPVTASSFVDAWNYGAYGANGQQNNSFYANIAGYPEINPETEDEG